MPLLWLLPPLVLAAFAVAFLLLFVRWLGGPSLRRWDEPRDGLVGGPEPSAEHHEVVESLRAMNRAIRSRPPWRRIPAIREELEKLLGDRPVEAEVRPVGCDGVPAEWVLAPGADPDRRLLYLHGGGFVAGSPESHRPLCADLSARLGAALLVLDYRLAPEHHRMAAVRDCRTGYRWILENGPEGPGAPAALFLAGDSAGGNLTLALSAWVRDRGLRQPDAVVALAPSTDGTMGSPSLRRNVATDPMLGRALLPLARFRVPLLFATWATVQRRPCHPDLSPVFGDLGGLPPTLVQASEEEVLIDDARRWVNKARAAGTPAELQTWRHVVHVFQAIGEALPEAADALDRIARFVERHAPGDGSRDGRGAPGER